MPAVTLAKALKMKKRLVGNIAKLAHDVRSFNSVLKEQQDKVDVAGKLERHNASIEALVSLKTLIHTAAVPIRQKIHDLQEKKGLVAFYEGIGTTEGKFRHDYQNTDLEYVAVLKKSDVEKKVKELNKAIDETQDAIDEFNGVTKLEVPASVLDLAS